MQTRPPPKVKIDETKPNTREFVRVSGTLSSNFLGSTPTWKLRKQTTAHPIPYMEDGEIPAKAKSHYT